MEFGDRGIMIAVIVIVLVGGSIFTLWWWRLADRWADAEHKRFRKAGLRDADTRERVAIKGFGTSDPAGSSGERRVGNPTGPESDRPPPPPNPREHNTR